MERRSEGEAEQGWGIFSIIRFDGCETWRALSTGFIFNVLCKGEVYQEEKHKLIRPHLGMDK